MYLSAALARNLGPVRIRVEGGFNYYDQEYTGTNSQGEIDERFGVEEME